MSASQAYTIRASWLEAVVRQLARMILLTLICIGLATPAVLQTTAAYAVGCSGSPANYDDGYYYGYGNQTAWNIGASAQIIVRIGGFCGGGNPSSNFYTEWSMMANGNYGAGWVQSGYLQQYGTNEQHFSQYTIDGVSDIHTIIRGNVYPGEVHHYWQEQNPNCTWPGVPANCYISYVDGYISQETDFNPWNSWSQPFSPQFEGEVPYLQDPMPGDSSAPVEQYSLQLQDYNRHWNPAPAILSYDDANPAMWGNYAYSSTDFITYEK